MKLKKILFAMAITFTAIGFSACTDESENIVPGPVNTDQPAGTVGTGGEDDDHM